MIKVILITAICTLLIQELIAFIVLSIRNDEEIAMYLAGGLLYGIIWVVCYPIRSWNAYSNSETYYRRHGISRWQYILLHKRVREDTR